MEGKAPPFALPYDSKNEFARESPHFGANLAQFNICLLLLEFLVPGVGF